MSENTDIQIYYANNTGLGHHKTSGLFSDVPLFIEYLLSVMLSTKPQRETEKEAKSLHTIDTDTCLSNTNVSLLCC